MAVIVDSIVPDPVQVPYGGTKDITVTAHAQPGDDPGTFELRFTPTGGSPQVLATVPGTIDNPDDPVPWTQIDVVPVSLPGVTVTRLSGAGNTGVYRATHTP